MASGYQGWDWANAALDLAVCSAITPRADYARAAIRYFRALLDDRFVIGDHQGGDDVVAHDDGYPIRTHGCLGALVYDWLHDAPGMTAELRSHAIDRFAAWSKWFAESGYNRDEPISNYFVSWFGETAFAGIAAQGDDPRASTMLADARRMFSSLITPAYDGKLAGGDFPEGWQYGDLVGTVLALFVDAESRASGRSSFGDFPWLQAVLDYRAHALWPDGKHTFDTGDWSDKPAVAPEHTLALLSIVLPPASDDSRRARALARLALDRGEEWHWLDALAIDSATPAIDPRRGRLSYLAPGTGAVIVRADDSPRSAWFAMTSAPALSDHQHLDAGHFELVRGSDALLVDSGGYGSYSSLSHNVIVVDDRKENDKYAPNQGTAGRDVRIERFEDAGRFVYALADYAGAYDPSGYPDDHPRRSVTRAEREVVFSRAPVPGLPPESVRAVIYDRVTLAKPSYGATFLLHGGTSPEVRAAGVRFLVGRSMAQVTSILPRNVAPILVSEPTNLGEGPYYANDPPEGQSSVRVEVRSVRSDSERRFLHAVVASAADANIGAPSEVEGDGVDGVAIADEVYAFSRSGPQRRPASESYRAPISVAHHIVTSLAPGASYALSVARDGDFCRVALQPGPGVRASEAGTIAFGVAADCTLTPPAPLSRAAAAR
jgi:hypothetical protein